MDTNNDLEFKIIELVNTIEKLPMIDRDNVIMFARNNEFGEALETLCSQIYEYDIIITQEILQKIIQLSKEMELKSSFDYLEELVVACDSPKFENHEKR